MSWLFSRALVEESWAAHCLGGGPSALSSLERHSEAYCYDARTTDSCAPSLSGMTCKPLTVTHGEELLTWSREGFPARTSAPPDEERESTVSNPASGFTWPGSFAKYDPATRSWRTRQCSLLGDLEEFSETWPRWGSMRDGECSAPSTPELRTKGNASGSWPTIRSTDGERGGRGDLIQAVRGNPNSHYRLWQTVVADDAVPRVNGKVNSRGEPKLSAQVLQFPTSSGLYTTPCADDTGHRQKKYAQGGTPLSMQAGGMLNPEWVEWLMGWPIGWTASAPLETAKFRQWWRSHGAR